MKKRGLNWRRTFGSIALIVGLGACDLGNGCGCVAPLPGGVELPPDQTLEGGAQVRVTESGFAKITSLIPAVLNDALAGGFCVPSDSVNILIGDIDWCYQNDGSCTPGCQADFSVDSIDVAVPRNDRLTIRAQFDTDIDVPIRFDPVIGSNSSCMMKATANNTVIDAVVTFGIDPASGELTIDLLDIPDLNVNLNVSGCGLIGDVIDAVVGGLLDVLEVDFIRDLIQPLLEDLVLGLLPDPLGLEGLLDASAVVPGVSRETAGSLEMRVVPGGYVFLENSGLSLGVITGINSDEDLATRGADLDSEPSLCVPPMAAPDFAGPPSSLAKSPRGNFNLLPAGAFRGTPDPAATDVILGASRTMLNQLGHHVVTSGGMCLGLGSELSAQLNVGTLGLLVPSLAELGSEDGNDPLLLVTRPQQAVEFTVGEGSATDPVLNLHLRDFEIDFYAFLFERYTRAFTVALTLDAGVNLEFALDANGDPAIVPTLVGLESSAIGIEVENAELLREGADTLEAVLPSIIDALLPQLTGGLGPIALPEFAGFTLTNLSVEKVSTSEDDFVAIAAELGASSLMRTLGQRFPSVGQLASEMPAVRAPAPVSAPARLLAVDVPPPDVVRAALKDEPGATLPSVAIEVATHDEAGRPLEWAYNLDGGIWRPFRSGSPLVVSDRAFAWQGRYTIELYSRVQGDYTTTSLEPIRIPVVIDSAPPRIHTHRAERTAAGIDVPVTDLISAPEAIEVAFGRVGEDAPSTGWGEGVVSAALAGSLAKDNIIVVWARDERGNTGSEPLDLDVLGFHGSGGEEGCSCSAGGGSAGSIAGTLLPLGLALALLAWRRRPRLLESRAGLLVLAVGIAGGAAACSCGEEAGAPICTEGQVQVCFDEEMSMCTCTDDIRLGRVGEHSSLALSPDNSYWVSAYNSTHGDLMVANVAELGRIPDAAWEFVAGVPDGPVNVPGSEIRGGIREPGPDVGLYTDIAVSSAGTVLVSYFSRETHSLEIAALSGGAWSIHTVDAGFLGGSEIGFEITGQYSAIAVGDDDVPVIAYFANIEEPEGQRTEVRVARASTAIPASEADWTIEVVEATPVPEAAEPDPLTIPRGSGLFIDLVLDSTGAPVLAYYDRQDGDLELARDDGAGGYTVTALDGADSDVGWYPGLAIDSNDRVHVSYVDASTDDLLYINSIDQTPELVDDGYRIVGETDQGLPEPEFHLVGDDSAVVLTSIGAVVIYQDATTHELLAARKDGAGNWLFEPVAGNEDPFAGGYGFYASAVRQDSSVVISTWVIDQPNNDSWVEILAYGTAVE